MEFIKYGNKYLVKDSPNIIVSEEEKLKLEKRELVLKDIESPDCQKETTKKIRRINKKIKEVEKDNIKINVNLETLNSEKIVEYIKDKNALHNEVENV